MFLQHAGQRCRLLRGGIGLIILEMPFHAGLNGFCHLGHIPLGHPAVRQSDVLLGVGDFDHAGDLGGKAGIALIPDVGIAQALVFAVVVVKDANIGFVGISGLPNPGGRHGL